MYMFCKHCKKESGGQYPKFWRIRIFGLTLFFGHKCNRCPYCGAKLEIRHYKITYDCAACPNRECEFYDHEIKLKMMRDLIAGKAAQDALKEATKCINWVIDTFDKGQELESDIVGCCEISLDRITSITKQGGTNDE